MKRFTHFAQMFLLGSMLFATACTKEAIDPTAPTMDATDEVLTLDDGQNVTYSLTAADGSTTTISGPPPGGSGGRGGRHTRHPGGMRGDSIGFAGLPTAAQQYLLTNTDTAKILRIVKITKPDGTIEYGARLNDHTHYHFDAAGAVLPDLPHGHAFEQIQITDLPTAAQTYLTTNGHTANVSHVVKITKRDGTVVYGVRLTDNTLIGFDADGNKIDLPKHKRRR